MYTYLKLLLFVCSLIFFSCKKEESAAPLSKSERIEVYPTYTSQYFSLSITSNNKAQAEVTIIGEDKQSQKFTLNIDNSVNHTVDVSSFKSGRIICQIVINSNVYIKNIFLQER